MNLCAGRAGAPGERGVSGKGKEGPLSTARSETFAGVPASDLSPSSEVFIFPPLWKLYLPNCCQKGFPRFAVPSLTLPPAVLLSTKCSPGSEDLRVVLSTPHSFRFRHPPTPISQPCFAWPGVTGRESCYLRAHTLGSALGRPRKNPQEPLLAGYQPVPDTKSLTGVTGSCQVRGRLRKPLLTASRPWPLRQGGVSAGI